MSKKLWLLIIVPITILLMAAAGWFIWDTNERRQADARVQRVKNIASLLDSEQCKTGDRVEADDGEYLALEAREAYWLTLDCSYSTSLADDEKYDIDISVSDRSKLIREVPSEINKYRCNNPTVGSRRNTALQSDDGVMLVVVWFDLAGFDPVEKAKGNQPPLTDQEQNILRQIITELQETLNENSGYNFEVLCL